VWQQLLRNKYLREKSLTQAQYTPGDSLFWAGLMKVKREFLLLGKFDLGDGSQVRFWEDSWIRSRPLKLIFPTLYNIVRRKKCVYKFSVIYDTIECSLQKIFDGC
jgi:hypothetical protein